MTIIEENPFWTRYSPFAVGFDRALRRLDQLSDVKAPSYPPYNIVQIDDNSYIVELAVAGFTEDDIEIVLKEQVLTITAAVKKDEIKYIHHGIAKRNFTRAFTLADSIEVKNVWFTDGMLRIELQNVIPEHKKTKTIPINKK
jgi:molecular chaperone IbpA